MNNTKQIPAFRNDAFRGLIGVSEVDITPPVGIYARSWGAAKHDRAEGVHKPLLLTVVTLQVSGRAKPLIMISAELGVWRSAADGARIRSAILDAFSVPASRLMFCLTHTHSGPVLSRDDAWKPGGELIDAYLVVLQKKAISAVRSALASASRSILTWNYGKCALATNRDLQDDAHDRIVTGFNPGKKADDTLLVGRITDQSGKITAVIVNYACHPTTLAWQNKLISPDYVGSTREVIREHIHAPCLFLQGASGDLAPRTQYVGAIDVCERNGRQLGFSVLATLADMLPPAMKLCFAGVVPSGADLGVWKLRKCRVNSRLAIQMHEVGYRLKEIPMLREIERRYQASDDRVLKERLWRQRSLRLALGDGATARVNVWVWKVGDALLIGQPNEAYSEFQIKLRRALAGTVAVINLVNGSAGYLAPRVLYRQHIYQVWQSPFAAGSFERLYRETLRVAKGLLS